MSNAVKRILSNNGLTVTQVAKDSNINQSTLSAAFKRPVDTWSVKILKALASSTGSSTDNLLNKLGDNSWSLKISNQNQTIQGYQIHDLTEFRIERFVVINECYESWRPNRDDIKNLVKSYQHPNPLIRSIVAKGVKELKDAE